MVTCNKIKALKALEAWAGVIKLEKLSRDSNVEFANLHCNNNDKKNIKKINKKKQNKTTKKKHVVTEI